MDNQGIATLIGGAGTGKTTELLRIMGKAIQAGGYDIRDVGFSSFTRAARSEAATRAASVFDCNPADLERYGWFKTLHAIVYKQLEVGDSLLGPGAKSKEWIQEAIQEEVSGLTDGPVEDAADRIGETTEADRVLNLWGLARNRLVPFEEVYTEVRNSSAIELWWDLERCLQVIGRYEQAKRLDGRVDFTDTLGRFAGWSFQLAGPVRVTPSGVCPSIPILFIDEAQDNTALMDAGFRRLAEKARWVYLSGDPFQSVYGWNGSDHRLFQEWPSAKKRILGQSFRCPSAILERGEDCLRLCSDYWDRGIQPVGAGGEVRELANRFDWSLDLDPRESWLLLARTNYQARRITGWLREDGVPWVPLKGNGGWKKTKASGAMAALRAAELGDPISVDDWKTIIGEVPAKHDGAELLRHGTKAEWKTREPESEFECRYAADLADWGGSELLIRMIQSGSWGTLIENGEQFRRAHARWGWEGVSDPHISIGTIHAAKGMEADNVVVLTTTSRPVWAAADSSPRQADEERRLAYVAVTRARKRVFLNVESSQYRMEALS